MNSMIFNPVEEFESKYRDLHFERTNNFLDRLVAQSNINIDENRETVRQYYEISQNLEKLRKKFNLYRFLRVLMIITILLIPLVIIKITPIIQKMRSDIEAADIRAQELLDEAYRQMAPLNALFTDRDAMTIIEETIPLISFDDCFSLEKEEDMKLNYDFYTYVDNEQSTIDVLSGQYNENPFLFENKFIHTMGTETYYGEKTISWTETYRDSNGDLRTRTRTETLHAQVVKPKPYYTTQIVLHYGSQGGPELCFTREAAHHEQKSDKAVERFIKKGEKQLKKMTDKAIKNNDDFVSMSNTGFEVLFNALDRNNEVQFRSLFTPLAQTNMVGLMRSQVGFGDDFDFFKANRMNLIVTEHSQDRAMIVTADHYPSFAFDQIKENFISANVAYFKAVYFDFAPIWAIPAYQERPVHSLKPIPEYNQKYSQKECEALVNAIDYRYVVHPDTKTPAILKSSFVRSDGSTDETSVAAYSYDIAQRIDYIPVRGGDGYYHDVPVPWDEYLPLEAFNSLYVTRTDLAGDRNVIASRDGLCIFN